MQIRRMAAPDLESIVGITALSPEAAAWTRHAYEALLEDASKGEARVAQQDREVVAFCCFRLVGNEAELLNLAVAPGSRRQGIAFRLVEHALAEVAERGAERIFLEVRASNAAALRLYERLGFGPVGRRPGYYQSPSEGTLAVLPEDAVLLAKRLIRPNSGGR